jgi:putative flippase GtrA
MSSSLTCAALDYLIFFGLLKIFGNIENGIILILYNCIARLISAITNYNLNKKRVFKSNGDHQSYGLKYAALAISILGANSLVLYCLTHFFSIPAFFAKIITELLLFIVSFSIQHRFIFVDARTKIRNQ